MILGKQGCNRVLISPAPPVIGTTAPGVGYKTVLIYVYEAGTSHINTSPPWFCQCLQYAMLENIAVRKEAKCCKMHTAILQTLQA